MIMHYTDQSEVKTSPVNTTIDMSCLNLTGEEADPVKAFIFRELFDASKKHEEEEKEQTENEEKRKQEERKEKNRKWRQQREERKKACSVSDEN